MVNVKLVFKEKDSKDTNKLFFCGYETFGKWVADNIEDIEVIDCIQEEQ